jgi:opacity protein-like surface antigen
MKSKVFAFLTVVALLTISIPSFAQQGYFTGHVGAAFPMGDFGEEDIDDDDAGNAGPGLNIGGKYIYPLNENGLSLFGGLDLMYNSLKSDYRDDLEDEFGSEVEHKFYKYINIPVMGGLNYSIKANDQISLFGEVGLGVNFVKLTNWTMEVDNEEMEATFDSSTKFAYKLGGGLLLDGGYSIAIHYFALGDHKIKGEIDYDGDKESFKWKREISMVTLTIGKRF